MDAPWLQALIAWMSAHPHWAGLLVGVIAFGESLAVVGILVPGAMILFGLGALVALGALDLTSALVWCSVGAILGDSTSFALGRRYQDHLPSRWPFSHYQALLDRGRRYFREYGVYSVLIARFIGPIRPVLPVVAGMMNMPLRQFVPVMIIAGILWSPAYILPGVVFGHSLELAGEVALRMGMLLVSIALLGWGIIQLLRLSGHGLARPVADFLRLLLASAQRHHLFGRFTHWLNDPKRPHSGSLGPLVMGGWLALLGLVSIVVIERRGGFPASRLASHVLAGMQSPVLDRTMAAFASLGEPVVIVAIGAIMAGWLLWRRRTRALLAWTLGLAGGVLLTEIWQVATFASPWWGFAGAKAVLPFGLFATLVSSQLPTRPRFSTYLGAALVGMPVLLAQLYFAAASLYSLLGGLFIAAVWTNSVAIAYRLGNRRHFLARPLRVIFSILVVFGLAWGAFVNYAGLIGKIDQKLRFPDRILSRYCAMDGPDLAGLSERPDSVLYAGSIRSLAAALTSAGWIAPPAFDWKNAMQIIRPDPEFADLPTLPQVRYGRKANLVVVHGEPDGAWVLRFWDSGQTTHGQSLFAGILRRQSQARSLFFFSFRRERELGTAALETLARKLPGLQPRLLVASGQSVHHWLLLADPAGEVCASGLPQSAK